MKKKNGMLRLDFNSVSSPNHLAKGVAAGVILFALTGSLPAYFATVALVHFGSCAFAALKNDRNEIKPSV